MPKKNSIIGPEFERFFLSIYGTEQQCRETLFRLRWPNGFVCSACGCAGFVIITPLSLLQCKQRQTPLICSIIFASTKLPLTLWFLASYLITQSKNSSLLSNWPDTWASLPMPPCASEV